MSAVESRTRNSTSSGSPSPNSSSTPRGSETARDQPRAVGGRPGNEPVDLFADILALDHAFRDEQLFQRSCTRGGRRLAVVRDWIVRMVVGHCVSSQCSKMSA